MTAMATTRSPGDPGPASKPRFPVPSFAWVVLLAGLLPSPVRADNNLSPSRWGGHFLIGRDSRAVSGPDSDGAHSGAGDPRFWFAEPVDMQIAMGLWAQWKLRVGGRRARLECGYERLEWAQGRILGRDRFDLEVRQTLSDRSRLEFATEYAPQVYAQHRVDKDAPPGAPRYRPQAYAELEVELGYRWQQGADLEPTVYLTQSWRDERVWFNERDRRRTGVGLAAEFPIGPVRMEPAYEFHVSRSRNQPDLGSDLSYHENRADLRLWAELHRWSGPWALEARMRWKHRRYTTEDPEDASRYHRREWIYYWMVKIRRAGVQVTPMLSLEAGGRWVNVSSGDGTIDEDGEIDSTLLRVGVEWVIESQ